MNGVTASRTSDHEQTIFMQSNYFHDPEELYLVLERMQAVDRGKGKIIIDMEKERIMQQSDGKKLRNVQIDGDTLKAELHTEEEFHYSIFSTIIGANGKEINSTSSMQFGFGEKGYSQIDVTAASFPRLYLLNCPFSLNG